MITVGVRYPSPPQLQLPFHIILQHVDTCDLRALYQLKGEQPFPQ